MTTATTNRVKAGGGSTIITLGVMAGALNTAHAATHGGSTFKAGMSSFLVVGGLLVVGAWNPDIAKMMAVLYFISSFFLNGEWLINLFVNLVGGSK